MRLCVGHEREARVSHAESNGSRAVATSPRQRTGTLEKLCINRVESSYVMSMNYPTSFDRGLMEEVETKQNLKLLFEGNKYLGSHGQATNVFAASVQFLTIQLNFLQCVDSIMRGRTGKHYCLPSRATWTASR